MTSGKHNRLRPRTDFSPERFVMRGSRRRIRSIVGFVVGVSLGIALILAAYAPGHLLGRVRFDGVQLNIAYSGEHPGIFGPTSQNACFQQAGLPLPPPPEPVGPDCPRYLYSGGQYDFAIFVWGAPLNTSFVFGNVSIHFSLPFQASSCQQALSPPMPSHNSSVRQELASGMWCGIIVEFSVPIPAPPSPSGLWMYANMTIHVT